MQHGIAVCDFIGKTPHVVALYEMQSALNPILNPILFTSGRGFLKEQTLKHIGIMYMNLVLGRRIKFAHISSI